MCTMKRNVIVVQSLLSTQGLAPVRFICEVSAFPLPLSLLHKATRFGSPLGQQHPVISTTLCKRHYCNDLDYSMIVAQLHFTCPTMVILSEADGWNPPTLLLAGGSIKTPSINGQKPFLESGLSRGNEIHQHDNVPPPNCEAPLKPPDEFESKSRQTSHNGDFNGINIRLYTFGEGDEPVSSDSLDPLDACRLWVDLRVSEDMSRLDVHKWFRRLEKSLRKGLDSENTLVIVLWHCAKSTEWIARQLLDKLKRRGIEATWLNPRVLPRQARSRSREDTSDPRHLQPDCQSGGDDGESNGYPLQSLSRRERRYGRYFDQQQVIRYL